ncbi:MAG: CBS domain-containing protein [Sterolibacterium sp.]|nr:CBS domain-containing protein [Sterolibacterium sp.]
MQLEQEIHAATESFSPDTPNPLSGGRGHKDHFLKLMWFQPSKVAEVSSKYGTPAHLPGRFRVLRQSKLATNAGYHLVDQDDTRVSAESSALDVMTDLRRVVAVTIAPSAFIEKANQTMIVHRVRALFVGDDLRFLGIVTASDILGEKPVQITQQRGIHHDEVLVRDVMTPADRLEVIDMSELRAARVGDVVETLKRAGRQHALAVHQASGGRQWITGIFSLTQIARQMGIAIEATDIGRTFAEIEAAIGW